MVIQDPVVIISALTSLFSQGVSGLVLAMPFAIIVVEKDILIIFATQNLILEILVVEEVDKIFIRVEVKMLLIGNQSSRETEVCPCLVAK